MKVASGPLIAYLNSGSVFQMALLYTITLLGGGVYRWTSADLSIVFGGNTFTSAIDQGGQPLIQRGPIRTVKGLEVDTLDITLLCGDTAQILGGNLTLAAHNGAFDGARVKVERLFMPSWGDTSLGSLVEFEGAVAGVDPASQQVILHVMSDLEKLQLQMPHVLFMPACANSFGDPACGIVLSTLTATGTAGASTNASQVTNVTGHVDGLGKIVRWEKSGADHVLEIAAPPEVMRYVIHKGSIAIDGISLTVAGVSKKSFRVWIIPHTFEVTVLRERKVGDAVNLEADMLGKYVEKILAARGRR